MTLEKLPPVLVLHLKRFVYEKAGGCQKLVKNVEYPVDLEISKGERVRGRDSAGVAPGVLRKFSFLPCGFACLHL